MGERELSQPPLVLIFEEPSVFEALDLGLLQNRGVRVMRFNTGRQALELSGENAPRLCLTPLELPDMQARELAARLSELFGPEHVSVVALLKAGSPEDAPVDPDRFAASALLPATREDMVTLMDRFVGVRLRRAERFPVRVQVKTDAHDGTTLDLSTRGLKVRTREVLEIGDRVELKFALPGSPDALSMAGRVVRVDTRTWAPEAALAIQFESPAAAETRRLEEYMASLVSGRIFRWRVDKGPEGAVAVLSGSIRQADDLADLCCDAPEGLSLDFSNLKKIEPRCFGVWGSFLRQAAGPGGTAQVLRVHFDLALQAAEDKRVLPGAVIRAVMLPFVCDDCGFADAFPVTPGTENLKQTCPQCNGPMTADEEIPDIKT